MNSEDYRSLINHLPTCPGILGGERYYRSAVLAPFVCINDEYQLLFEKRAPDIRQGGEICFPGGGVDGNIDADSSLTALRETGEELGISQDLIRIHGKTDSVIAALGTLVEVYVGEITIRSLEECHINPAEVEEIFTVPFSFFIEHPPREYELHLEIKPSYFDEAGNEVILFPVEELGLPERYSRPWKGRNHSVLVYKCGKHTIWGITARIVDSLVKLYNIDKP